MTILKPFLLTVISVAHMVGVAQRSNQILLLEDDLPTQRQKRKREERGESHFRRNSGVSFGPPTIPLEPVNVLQIVLRDLNRNYMGKMCHMQSWQFFLLADKLKDLIERPRLRVDGTRSQKIEPSAKFDHYHRLFFCLEWLNSGTFYRTTECRTGWGKSSLQEDNNHVLRAIIEGLDDQLAWPNEQRRAVLASKHRGVFNGMVGIMDIKEHQIRKSEDSAKESLSWSTKHKMNSIKNLSVIDYSGRFIYVQVGFGKNDREFFTNTPLYMQKGFYFDVGQWVAADGGFHGDGPVRASYDNPGVNEARKLFNVVFREVRVGIETAFARMCNWFPILGVNKGASNYDDETTMLSIHAACRLHNWIMNTENLCYDAETSAENYFRPFY